MRPAGIHRPKGPFYQEGAVAAGDWGRNPRRSGERAMQLASSDAAAVLFFLYKEKEKNGGANFVSFSGRGKETVSQKEQTLLSCPLRA